MAKVKFRVYARDIRAAVKNEVEGPILALTKNPDVLRSIAQEALEIVTPYVPMKSGDLVTSGHVVQNSKQTNIIWGDPGVGKTLYYAAYQHDNFFANRTLEFHPKAKSFWTEELERGTPGFEELIAFAAPLMQREVKHGR